MLVFLSATLLSLWASAFGQINEDDVKNLLSERDTTIPSLIRAAEKQVGALKKAADAKGFDSKEMLLVSSAVINAKIIAATAVELEQSPGITPKWPGEAQKAADTAALSGAEFAKASSAAGRISERALARFRSTSELASEIQAKITAVADEDSERTQLDVNNAKDDLSKLRRDFEDLRGELRKAESEIWMLLEDAAKAYETTREALDTAADSAQKSEAEAVKLRAEQPESLDEPVDTSTVSAAIAGANKAEESLLVEFSGGEAAAPNVVAATPIGAVRDQAVSEAKAWQEEAKNQREEDPAELARLAKEREEEKRKDAVKFQKENGVSGPSEDDDDAASSERTAIVDAFKLFDTNDDGRISSGDELNFLRLAANEFFPFAVVDDGIEPQNGRLLDDNGDLLEKGFEQLMGNSVLWGQPNEDIVEAFKSMDEDNDDKISITDLKLFAKTIGQSTDGQTKYGDELATTLKNAVAWGDRDANGLLDEQEFAHIVDQALLSQLS